MSFRHWLRVAYVLSFVALIVALIITNSLDPWHGA